MKKLLFLLSFFASLSAFSQVKIGGAGDLVPLGNYPAVKIGNYQTGTYPVQTLVQRNAIPSYMRIPFMSVYIADSLKSYRLGTDLTTWTEILSVDNTKLALTGGTVTGTISVNPASGPAFTKTGIANNTEHILMSAATTDAARGKMNIRFANTVINGETDPITSIGYAEPTNGTEEKAGERGLVIHIEGNYNDGSGQNKMEIYPQYAGGGGIFKRPWFIQMNKVTHKISSFQMSGDDIKMYADSAPSGPGSEIPSYTFSRNNLIVHPVFGNQVNKITIEAATGQQGLLSQGFNGLADKWLQYHDAADQFGFDLNGRRVATWYSKLSGAGTAGAGLSIGESSNQAILTASTATSHPSLRTIVAKVSATQYGNAFEVQDPSANALFTITPTGTVGRILNVDTAIKIGSAYNGDVLFLGRNNPGGATEQKTLVFQPGGFAQPTTAYARTTGDKIELFSNSSAGFSWKLGVGTNSNAWNATNGKYEWYTGSSWTTPKLTLSATGSMLLGGTGGGGYINLPLQTSNPATPGNGVNIFSDVNNAFAFRSAASAFTAVFSTVANTADQTYTFPDATGTALIGSAVNTVSPTAPNRTITIKIGATTYYLAAKTTND